MKEEIEILVKYEGLDVDEARLSYKRRQDLPNSAFCGPNRTYPAHDAAHVRNGLARLSRFGHRLPQAVRAKILACLKRRAKRFGVEVGESYRWNNDGSVNPSYKKRVEETVQWYLSKRGMTDEAFWIQKAITHRGALRKSLGIREDEVIPESLLRHIINTDTGKTVSFRGRSIRVTTQMKRRAILALRLRHMPKRGRVKESASPKYKIQAVKGRFAVMVATGKKFPPWKVVKVFATRAEAQAFIDKQK